MITRLTVRNFKRLRDVEIPLATLMRPDEIDPEIVEKLDAIAKTASMAKPADD